MKNLILRFSAVLTTVLFAMLLTNSWVLAQGNGNEQGNNEEKITICHFPPGNPGNPQTITISPNALDAHLAHGDYLGPCRREIEEIELIKLRNSPNPYLESTTIEYDLREESFVRMDVYNQSGNKIHTIVNETKQAGNHSHNFSAKSLGYPAGIHLLKAAASTETEYVERSVTIIEIDY